MVGAPRAPGRRPPPGPASASPAQEPEEPVPLDAARAAGAAARAAGRAARRDLHQRARRARRPRLRQVLPRHDPRLPRRLRARPDLVARPRDERDIEQLLEWAAGANAAVIPYGGGTSVVGGVEARIPERFDGALCLDLGALDELHELDEVSRAACLGAGAAGPRVEQLLGEHGMTMRFFPQSFELSTLGGWITTRAGGHFATRLTHVDDLVESIRAITPSGVWESRRLPGSGAARARTGCCSARRARSAWSRAHGCASSRGREHRASQAVRFAGFLRGAEAVRALAQSGLDPSNCRLIDELEAQQTGAGDGTHALLVLGFESTACPVDEHMAARARDLPRARRRVGRAAAAAPTSAPGATRSCGCPTCATCSSASASSRHVRDGDHVGPPARRSTRR